MHGYCVFGLRLGATHRLPGLTPSAGGAPWDIVVRLGAQPPAVHEPLETDPLYVSEDRDEAGCPLLVVRWLEGAGLFWLRYADGTDCVVDRAGTQIWVRWPEPWTLDDAATYLVGPVLAFALRRRGVTCLHASAVAVGERAVALVGPAGAGKSTLAAGFARRGHAALSDDVVALERDGRRFRIRPGPTRVRLWPDSVTALYGAPDALPRLTPTWDKRFLDLRQSEDHPPEPLPLAAIYVVTEAEPIAARAGVESLSMVESLLALVANTSTNYLLDGALRGQEFECLSDVVRSVPVRRLVRGHDPAGVLDVCDMIVRDVQHV